VGIKRVSNYHGTVPMPLLTRLLAICSIAMLSACATTAGRTNPDSEQQVMQRAQLLLDRYARNDQAGVIALLDPERITILGTGFNEKVQSAADLRALMDRDFAQWQSAKFTDVRDVDLRSDGALATAYFTVTFSAGTGPTLPLRMFTTWRKVDGEWLLTQSGTAIPPQA
jgi:hypothetical protein